MVSQSVDMPLSEEATKAGTSFVFGYLGGGSLPFEEKYPGASFVLALQALPLVLVVSALSSLLFYWRILPYIVKAFSFEPRSVSISPKLLSLFSHIPGRQSPSRSPLQGLQAQGYCALFSSQE